MFTSCTVLDWSFICFSWRCSYVLLVFNSINIFLGWIEKYSLLTFRTLPRFTDSSFKGGKTSYTRITRENYITCALNLKYCFKTPKEISSYHVWNEVYPFLCIGEHLRNIRNEKQSRKSAIFVSVRAEERAACVHIQRRRRSEPICSSSQQPLTERDWRLAQAASPSVWLGRGGTWKGSGILLETPNIKRAAQSPPWAPWAGRQLNASIRADTNRCFGQMLNSTLWNTIVWINCKVNFF